MKENIFFLRKKNNKKLINDIRFFFKLIFILLLIFLILNFKKNFFFFELDKNEYCKNEALLVYDYVYNFERPFNEVNIGDYIQSLAALQYIPKKCVPILIDRDTIQYYHGPKVKLLMNGWFYIKEGNKYTSEKIVPLYLSYHLQNFVNDSRMIAHLKKYQPIGCRDNYTKKLLIKHGIKAYFSSCLTTTLDINYYKGDSFRNDEIIFTDFKFGYYKEADECIKNLKAYNFTNITYLTHISSNKLNHSERFQIANKYLRKYARAKLVITTRIHAALPCLSLKTPVILINNYYDFNRYDGIYDLLNTIGINSNNVFEINININKNGFVFNSEKYLNYSINLKKIIKEKFQK